MTMHLTQTIKPRLRLRLESSVGRPYHVRCEDRVVNFASGAHALARAELEARRTPGASIEFWKNGEPTLALVIFDGRHLGYLHRPDWVAKCELPCR